MKILISVILVLLSSYHEVNCENIMKTSFNAGKDIGDYESGIENIYYKGTTEISSGDILRIEAMEYYNAGDGRSFYSYGLEGKTVFLPVTIYAGSFNLNSGTGLSLGKKRFLISDPFTGKLHSSTERDIDLTGTSNPAYTFHGLSGKTRFLTGKERLSLTAFLSRRKRYMNDDGIENSGTDSSLNTVLAKTYSCGNFTNPVYVNDRGFILSATAADIFTLQFHHCRTDMEDENGERLTWLMDRTDSVKGIKEVKLLGAFASLNIRDFSCFLEAASTSFKSDKTVNGRAVKYGILYTSKRTRLEMTGKTSDLNFYSPYASGRTFPERIMEMNASWSAMKILRPGVRFYSEEDLTPDRYDDEMDRKIIEELHIKSKFPLKTDTAFKFRNLTYGDAENIRQLTASLKFAYFSNFELGINSSFQQCEDNDASGAGASLKIQIFKYFNIEGGYARVTGKDECRLYWTGRPVASGLISGGFYRDRAQICIIKGTYKKGKDSANFRYENIKSEKSGDRRLSFSCTLLIDL